jgi:hypothetical protein
VQNSSRKGNDLLMSGMRGGYVSRRILRRRSRPDDRLLHRRRERIMQRRRR